MQHKRNVTITIIRSMAFLLVLLGHSFPDSAYEFINPFTKACFDWIYSFHMSLFFMVSGYCMTNTILGKNNRFIEQITKRAKRLLVPYFVYSGIAIIPKLVFRDYMYKKLDISELWKILIGDSPSGTLWYLFSLFEVFCFFFTFSRLTTDIRLYIVISILFYVIFCIYPITELRSLKYSLFFVIGIVIQQNWERISAFFEGRGLLSILLYVAIIPFVLISKWNQNIVFLVTSLIGISATICLGIYVNDRTKFIKESLIGMSYYSYGIYLISAFIQVPIRIFIYKKMQVPYGLCMFLMLILGYIIPYILIKFILRKNVITRLLFLGEN